jgi:8-amino-7-oxononanoate synthase
MGALDFLDDEIQRLQQAGLLRVRPPPAPASTVNACSNDYLGYTRGKLPLGATGSRLVVGDHTEHSRLEILLAAWVDMPAALLTSSGFAANLAAASAFTGQGDTLVSFDLNHASIIDGCRLSRADVHIVPLHDLSAAARVLRLPARRKWVITESYFSMDGIVADLRSLRALCDEAGAALIVDEAHALGVFGPTGAGQCEAQGVRPDVLVGTLGKAVGAQGAFLASTANAIAWLWNKARAFVFSTGVSPWLCSKIHQRVARTKQDHAARARLAHNVAFFRAALASHAIPVAPGSSGPIIPVIVGDPRPALECERRLLEAGFVVRAIRPPTVPDGTARLRITMTAGMTHATINKLVLALKESL